MSDPVFFTVMELAEKVGVPRTTINDWLNKYSTYIEYTMQGKRRIYSENTLKILIKVSELRNAGTSSFDIEQVLSKTFAIHPETAETEEEPAVSPAEPSSAPEKTGETSLPASIDYAAVVRTQTNEITGLLGERFQDILSKMDSLEDKARKNAVRAWYFSAFAAILIVLLGIGGYAAWKYQQRQEAESVKKEQALHELHIQTQSLQEKGISMEDQIRKLQEELPAQREAFGKALVEMQQNADRRREAEIAAEREKFASMQLAHVHELEARKAESEKRISEEMKKGAVKDEKIKEMETSLAGKEKKLEELRAEIERLRTDSYSKLKSEPKGK